MNNMLRVQGSKKKLSPGRIVTVYAAAGGLWILLSDILVGLISKDPEVISRLQTYKGWSYVAVTALILYWLVRRYRDEYERAEESLTTEKKISDKIIENLPGIFYLFDEQGKFLRWNRNLEEVSGYSSQEIAKMRPLDFFVGEDRRIEEEHIKNIFKKGLSTSEAEMAARDGRRATFFFTCDMITIAGMNYIIGTGIDITERKRLESQLLHAQKMESIGRIAAGISHDFNNILTAIIGYASIMRKKMGRDDPLRINIDQILASADRAAYLTQSLLSFSRKRVNMPVKTNLSATIKEVVKLLLRVIGENIELKTTLPDEDVIVMADTSQMEQILMNLATNARDAMPDGGILSIRVGTVEIEREFIRAHGYGKPGMYALISVSDTGTGMDKGTTKRIFEPFFTTKEVGKGTGLGLSIVYGIVNQHGGYVNCYSEEGKGTTFRVYLPMVMSAQAVEAGEAEMPDKFITGTETVLVAEDEEVVRNLTREVLEEMGYEVIEAVNGEDAMEKFSAHRDKIRLLLFDLIMPKIGGREAYEKIRETRPDIRALFMSGYYEGYVSGQNITGPGSDLLMKPVSPTELLKKVREVLDR